MGRHHATMPPSAMPALSKCALYKAAPSGSAATEGTRQHEVLATALTRYIETGSKIDDALSETEYGVFWSATQITEIHARVGGRLYVEEEVVVLKDGFTEVTFGTADAVIVPVMGTDIYLFDFKSGERRDYDAQMAAYGLGLMQRFNRYNVHAFLLYGKHREMDEVVFSRQQAEALVYRIAEQVSSVDKTPIMCDYCTWCTNAATCPVMNRSAVSIVRGYDLDAFEEWHPSKIDDPDTMGKMLAAAGIIQGWVDSVKFHAKQNAMMGITPTGYDLGKGRISREVTDIQGLFEASGLSAEEFLSCCDVGITKLRKKLGKNTDNILAPYSDATMGEPILRKKSK